MRPFPDRRYRYFAGQQMAVASRSYNQKLQQAKQLERERVAAEDIRQRTGWFRGKYDHRWRVELPDSGITAQDLPFEPVYDAKLKLWLHTLETPLPALVTDPLLFEAYPVLRLLHVRLQYGAGVDAQAEYHHGNQHIAVLAETREGLHPLLIHELQHALQSAENFSRGGCPDDYKRDEKGRFKPYAERLAVYRTLAGEIEARDAQARASYCPRHRRAVPPYSSEDIPQHEAILRYHE